MLGIPQSVQGSSRFSPSTLALTGICALVYLLDGLIHSILGPLAPDVARTLHLADSQLGPIFSANLVGQLIGLVLIPVISTRVGQRAIVIACVAGFGLTQGATALAVSAGTMLTSRLVTGIFLGGCLPSCLALVTEAAPPTRRGLTIMILFTGYGLGATLAGVIATAFPGTGGWRAAMWTVGGVCMVTATISYLFMPAEPHTPHGELSGTETSGRTRLRELLGSRYRVGTLMLWLLFMSMLTISYCLSSWLPVLLVKVGRSASTAALSVSIFSLGGIISALGVGLLIDRFGAGRTLTTFMAVSTVLLFVLGRVIATASTSVLLALLAVCGFFVLGAYGGVNVTLALFYPARLRAVGIGCTKSVGRIGTLVTPILIGWALGAGMPETAILSFFAVPALAALTALAVLAVIGDRSGGDVP